MKIVCGPEGFDFTPYQADLEIDLYHIVQGRSSTGRKVFQEVNRRKLLLPSKSWDFLSFALSVIAADRAVSRKQSSDGWTRQIELIVAVNNPDSWEETKLVLEKALFFLSTDLWSFHFVDGGFLPDPPKKIFKPQESSVALLSGGLDSLIGAVDLVTIGITPFLVSQTVTGDKAKQQNFASTIGNGLNQIQLNHSMKVAKPDSSPPSQRTRSIIFLAYGVLMATSLKAYENGDDITLYMSENGLISINPPLTNARVGSLSTRTTHPIFIKYIQQALDELGFRVKIYNRYFDQTKGEMLVNSNSQDYLIRKAHESTSCGRFGVNARRHCGRCVPCLIRRAAFHKWGVQDRTNYVYQDLSIADSHHKYFNDVRAAGIAALTLEENGIESLVGSNLNRAILGDISPYLEVAERGINELKLFLRSNNALWLIYTATWICIQILFL